MNYVKQFNLNWLVITLTILGSASGIVIESATRGLLGRAFRRRENMVGVNMVLA